MSVLEDLEIEQQIDLQEYESDQSLAENRLQSALVVARNIMIGALCAIFAAALLHMFRGILLARRLNY